MKKIFKNLIPASTLTVVALTSCAASNEEKKEEDTKTIEIVSDLNAITLTLNQDFVSKPVEAKCFNKNKQEIQLDYKVGLIPIKNEELPEWISITDNNEIQIKGNKALGTYVFDVFAYNDIERICSPVKTLTLHVIKEEHIFPDRIKMSITDNEWCMVGEETSLPIKITAVKGEIPEKELIKSCTFTLKVLEGKSTDTQNKPLFSFNNTDESSSLVISKNTNETYIGKYKLRIVASLTEKPSIHDVLEITLNINNIKRYEENNVVYVRNSKDENWTIDSFPSNVERIDNLLNFIQNKPVTAIADNICSKSRVGELVEVVLPDSINTIGQYAFKGQSKLCSFAAPGLKHVKKQGFANCVVLEFDSNYQQPSLEIVEDYGFVNCYQLDLSVQQNLIEVGNYAFTNAKFVTLEIGENCKSIGFDAFSQLRKLTTVRIWTKTPPVLKGSNFSRDDKLESIQVPSDALDAYNADEAWNSIGVRIEGI